MTDPGKSARFTLRYFCNSEDPDAKRSWFVLDRTTGMPVFDEFGIRYFEKHEAMQFLSQAGKE
jgi:hypothetical protein